MSGDFFKENTQDWANIHQDIFNGAIPSHAEWTNLRDIVNVLNKIGNISDSNHAFFPSSGGLDLEGAKLSVEAGCLELNFGIAHIVRPEKLVFEGIDDKQEWNYFRLETLPLKPSGLYELPDEYFDEEVLELSPGNYVDMCYWDNNEYHGEPLPKSARPIVRWFKGAIVIFKKSSRYNNARETYDARHEKLGAQGFKDHILKAYERVGNEPLTV